ncbi:MAG: GGDEF domain-containing protein, partial [Gammaproteobacteria bacterium]|nr:GGDEF domain-containing protein [Gammaproteobacteria bacterium]
ADQAFYYSKNNGRNQVTFFDDLVAMNKAKVEPVESGEIDLF